MIRPCVWCRELFTAEQLEAGRRCESCSLREFDAALAVLAAGLRSKRRWVA